MLIYGVDLIIVIADAIGYTDISLENLVERVLGRGHKMVTIVTNWIGCFAVSVASVIISVKFVTFSSQQLGANFDHMRLWYNLFGFMIVAPTAFIHNFKAFKFLATGALGVMLVAIISILYYDINHLSIHGISPTANTFDWLKWPEFFGVTCFAVEGVPCIIPIRASLKRRDKFRTLFWGVMSISAFLLITFGLLGCLTFGAGIKSIIFLNFPSSQAYYFSLQMMYGFCCIMTFPMYVNVSCNIICNISAFKPAFIDHKHSYWWCTLLRFCTILALFVISATKLDITDILHFAGAVCNCYLAVIMPCLGYMKWFGSEVSTCKKIGLWSFIILGSGFTCLSVFSSVWSITHRQYHEDRRLGGGNYGF